MPPRFAYWTLLIDNKPTAFRAREKEDLVPTLQQLRRTNKDVVMKWFARGRLWESPEQASTEQRSPRPAGEKRGSGWRPGGQHTDTTRPVQEEAGRSAPGPRVNRPHVAIARSWARRVTNALAQRRPFALTAAPQAQHAHFRIGLGAQRPAASVQGAHARTADLQANGRHGVPNRKAAAQPQNGRGAASRRAAGQVASDPGAASQRVEPAGHSARAATHGVSRNSFPSDANANQRRRPSPRAIPVPSHRLRRRKRRRSPGRRSAADRLGGRRVMTRF